MKPLTVMLAVYFMLPSGLVVVLFVLMAAGLITGKPDFASEVKRLLACFGIGLKKKIPKLHSEQIFSYMCQKAPGIARLFRKMLSEGYSRGGCSAMIHGALIRWANE